MPAAGIEFAGSAPGVRFDAIVDAFDRSAFDAVLGADVVSALAAMDEASDSSTRLSRAAARMLTGDAVRLMQIQSVRSVCFAALDPDKAVELERRTGVPRAVLCGPTPPPESILAMLAFFGVDVSSPKDSVPSAHVAADVAYGLFEHQRRASRDVVASLRSGSGRVMLHMPTGSGKTRTAMHVIADILNSEDRSLVVWLASSAELLDQAADAFLEAWPSLGNRTVGVGRLWGRFEFDPEELEDGLLVAGIQKLYAYKKKYGIEFLRLARRTRLVVVDEAHQVIAPTYREVADSLASTGTTTSLLGLTASPGRTWSDIDADAELSGFFQGRKVLLRASGWKDPVSYLLEEGYLASPRFRKVEFANQVPTKAEPQLDYDLELLEALSRNADRNKVLVAEVQRLVAEGHRRVILFAASVRHAHALCAILTALGLTSDVVSGETSAASRSRIIGRFRRSSDEPIVLCNFGVLTAGFDAPTTSAVLVARPTRSLVLFSQMVGRAMRGPRAGGNEKCEIVSVVDTNLPGFGDVTEAFMNWEDVWHDGQQ